MDKPVMRSTTQFADYLAEHLGMIRMMRKLSRDDPFFVAQDELFGERWCSVINGRCPTPEQRQRALEDRLSVAILFPRVQPATRELLVRVHSLQAYANSLPLPGGAAAGWDMRADLIHPDNTIKLLNAAIDDAKMLTGLDPDNVYFKELFEQLLEMARWTRTSLNPTPQDRAKVHLGDVTQEKLDVELKNVLTRVCRSMHDFCDLYANFPTLPPMPKIHLEPIKGPPPPPTPTPVPEIGPPATGGDAQNEG